MLLFFWPISYNTLHKLSSPLKKIKNRPKQSAGLADKIHVSSSFIILRWLQKDLNDYLTEVSFFYFYSWPTRIRTLKWRSQSPLPYHLAMGHCCLHIVLLAFDMMYYITPFKKNQALFLNFLKFFSVRNNGWGKGGGMDARTPGEGICAVFLRRLQNVKNP